MPVLFDLPSVDTSDQRNKEGKLYLPSERYGVKVAIQGRIYVSIGFPTKAECLAFLGRNAGQLGEEAIIYRRADGKILHREMR